MLPLSAIDAIGPAWSHTRRLLWDNRSWRTLLKIGAVAFFAQFLGFNFNSSSHLPHDHQFPAFSAILVSVILFAAFVGLLISLAFFYLGSRLQFVLFEIVLRSDTTVAPIWRRYGAATWRWMGLKFLFGLGCAALCAPLLIPIVLGIIHAFDSNMQNGSLQNPGAFVMTILGFIGAIFLIIIIIGVVFSLLHDFGLPSMALESTPMGETASRIWRLVRAEPLQCLLYLIMRFVLNFAGTLCAEFILVFASLIALVPLGGLGVVDYFVLHNAGIGGKVLMVLIWVLLGALFFVLFFAALIMLVGYILTFLQAYALYFLGGRYPLLGQYLAPFWPASHRIIPPPAYEPPPVPSAPPAFDAPAA